MNSSHEPNLPINASVSLISRGTVQIVIESCIFVILNIAALVGNALVCLAWYRNPSLRTVTNIFILSLGLTDLLMAVLVMPVFTGSYVANTFIGGKYSCTVLVLFGLILEGVSLLTVMLLAVNRYFRVVRPARYPNIYSYKRAKLMAVCPWIVTPVITGVFYSVGRPQYRSHPDYPTVPIVDFLNKDASIAFSVGHSFYTVVPSVVIATCYVKIYQTIRQHNTAAAPSSQGGHSPYGVEEAKLTRLLTIILVGFYLRWMPPFVAIILSTFHGIGETGLKYFNFYYTFPGFASSVINPIIYGTMSQPFRKEFLKILRRS